MNNKREVISDWIDEAREMKEKIEEETRFTVTDVPDKKTAASGHDFFEFTLRPRSMDLLDVNTIGNHFNLKNISFSYSTRDKYEIVVTVKIWRQEGSS